MVYLCDGCAKVFKVKGVYDKHKARKTPCKPATATATAATAASAAATTAAVAVTAVAPANTIVLDKKDKKDKKDKGQFYTVKSAYILDGLSLPPATARCVLEPFAGKGDLLEWLKAQGNSLPVEAYDIDPKSEGTVQRDTLLHPPLYANTWILTNPPYLARNKCDKKEMFDKYYTNDLYKCFITSLTQQEEPCAGGIFIIPAGFFLSPRDLDVRCRHEFLSRYRLLRVKYFEETVFPDTTTTVVAFAFERSPVRLAEQTVEWVSLPKRETRSFTMRQSQDWIIGGDIYKLVPAPGIKIRRFVEGQVAKTGEQITSMTLNALDSGTKEGRISLTYREGYVYPAKDCSSTYATLCIQGRTLTAEEQRLLCQRFNELLEQKRGETWSLFLPQFRESKEYARKRIPFELAYSIVEHLIAGL